MVAADPRRPNQRELPVALAQREVAWPYQVVNLALNKRAAHKGIVTQGTLTKLRSCEIPS
jgi:hypothetical protein